jgi:hypothetical protein
MCVCSSCKGARVDVPD